MESDYLMQEELAAHGIVAEDTEMLQIYKMAKRFSRMSATVLIHGESGVGKSQLARYIHDSSPRAGAPFVVINCAAIPSELFSSELFGYMPSSFTGASPRGKIGLLEAADHGTVLFDEIDEMRPEAQISLLQFLQDKQLTPVGGLKSKTIDTRILCTAIHDLRELVRQGKFRLDLYYRICVLRLTVPPLRRRKKDIAPLVRKILLQTGTQNAAERQFTPDAIEFLAEQDWMGNIRELENVIQQICIMEDRMTITRNLLKKSYVFSKMDGRRENLVSKHMTLKEAVREFESSYIQQVLDDSENLKQAADRLGLSMSTLCRKKRQMALTKCHVKR